MSFLPAIVTAASCLFIGSATAAGGETRPTQQTQGRHMFKVRIQADGGTVTATLDNNETTRDFVALLPLTLILEDYAATEKIADLPRKLSTRGAPAGTIPAPGDVCLYAPWGNLAIFHKDFKYSSGLVRLGKIDTGLEVLRRPGRMKATFSLTEQ